MNEMNPGLRAFLWFLGITVLTGSFLLGTVAAFISYSNSMKRIGRRRYDQTGADFRDRRQSTWGEGNGSLRPDGSEEMPDFSADYDEDAQYVEFETYKEAEAGAKRAEPMTETERESARYLASIGLAKSGIDDEKILKRISELEKIIENIYIRLEERPEQTKAVRNFMSRAMPLTTRVLESYSQINLKDLQSEEFSKMEKEVNDLLDSTKKAYTRLYDSMYDGDIMDISSEISVLKTLLSQEGLLDSGLGTAEVGKDEAAEENSADVQDAETEQVTG